MADPHARALIDEHDQLKSDRSPTEATWGELRDYILPMAGPPVGMESPGQKQGGKVYTNFGETTAEMLANGLQGNAMNRATRWLTIRTGDPDLDRRYDVIRWGDHAGEVILALCAAAGGRFYLTQTELDLEKVSFGTATKYLWDEPDGRLLFRHCPQSSVLIAEGTDMAVNTWHRRFDFTARQAYAKWGEAAGPAVVKCHEKEPNRRFTFQHSVQERRGRRPGRMDRANMPWASDYLAVQDGHTIDRGGRWEKPFVTSRFAVRREAESSELYGRGPGHRALSDVKSLQALWRITVRGGEKAIDPPLMVADDGVVTSAVRSNAGGLTYYRAGTYSLDPIKQLVTGANIQVAEYLLREIKDGIARAFYRDEILAMRRLAEAYSRPATATEVLEAAKESIRIMGPLYARYEAEDLEPTIETMLFIAARNGWLKPPPDVIATRPTLQARFVSPISEAYRLADVTGVQRTIGILSPLVVEGQRGDLLDNFDLDATAREIADIMNWPVRGIRAPEAVAEIRKARAEEQAKQAALMEAEQMASIARHGADAMSMLRAA